MRDYNDFLCRKSHVGGNYGFEVSDLPSFLFDFQTELVRWALLKGRGALFCDCGLGKTPMQLVWAENVVRKTGGRILILTPLAVSHQTIREAEKFGIECHRSRRGELHPGINVTNYEQLDHFRREDFAGVVCDESSILKSFDGATKKKVTDFMRKMKYRLLCTATAAPNDYHELGTSSEALGGLGHMDMLNRFFKNDSNNSATGRKYGEVVKWRLKGHAEVPFWRWVCSWARAIRKPSDLGFDDGRFVLPPLEEREHIVEAHRPPDGKLFDLPAIGLYEQREERRRTMTERCERVASLVSGNGHQSLVWCHLNPEGDILEKIIPGAEQVSGADSDERKEELFIAFASGQLRTLVTKPKIGAWGLNFQKCSHITFFPSHSYEQFYQGVRRCWRFGQERRVVVDIVTTKGERPVMDNLRRKAKDADRMFSALTEHMNNALKVDHSVNFKKTEEIPAWLSSIKK